MDEKPTKKYTFVDTDGTIVEAENIAEALKMLGYDSIFDV